MTDVSQAPSDPFDQRLVSEFEEGLLQAEALLDAAPIGFTVYDLEHRIVDVNPMTAEMNGVPREEQRGRRLAELRPDLAAQVDPLIDTWLREGVPVTNAPLRVASPDGNEEWHWLTSVFPIKISSGEIIGVGATRVDVTAQMETELALRLIVRATDVVNTAEDPGVVMDGLARIAIPEFADGCAIALLEDDVLRRVALAHADPETETLLYRLPADLATWRQIEPVAGAVQSGQPQLTPRPARDGRPLPRSAAQVASDLQVVSTITAPLLIDGVVGGTVTYLRTQHSGRRFSTRDLVLVSELTARIAAALAGQRLRAQAERASARVELLARVGELIATELDVHERAQAFARAFVPDFADRCAVVLYEENATVARVIAVATREGIVDPPVALYDVTGDLPMHQAVKQRWPQRWTADKLQEFFKSLPENKDYVDWMNLRSVILVPLLARNEPLGGIALVSYADSNTHALDDALALEIGRRVGASLEHAVRFETERATAEVLQRSLLPTSLPSRFGLHIAARYVPGSDHARVGGDWYDAVELSDGRIVIAIGDVVGHGPPAAAAMARLRAGLHVAVLDSDRPGELLGRLNRYLLTDSDATMATALLAVHDPSSGRLVFANAGHPPPIVVRAGGKVEIIELPAGIPIGAVDSVSYGEVDADLGDGDLLVLYTDGLVERRGESLDVGLERLCTAAAAEAGDPDVLLDSLLELVLPDTGAADDIALLAIKRVIPAPGLALALDATPETLASLRQDLRDWLTNIGAHGREADEMIVAVNEAAANAIEHAYERVGERFWVEGYVSNDEAVIQVRDAGRWRPPQEVEDRGRGFDLMRGLVDALDVRATNDGTEVTLRRRLQRARERDLASI